MRHLPFPVLALFPTVALSATFDGFVSRDRLPTPDNVVSQLGGMVWKETRQDCHDGNKFTGPPKTIGRKFWAPRIARGFDVLFDQAINGFIGPRYMEMPSRGENAELSDNKVKADVAFMVGTSGGPDKATARAAKQSME